MRYWKIILSYDGTPYHGWQIQPNLPTVQGTLAEAIRRITDETVLPQGSGRTDAGVHAIGQVASFSLSSPIPADNLHRALNHALPASIRVLSVEGVEPGFHARHSARRKTYEYRILPGDRICAPMLAPYLWVHRRTLDLDTLNQAAAHVAGTHDFTSFAATDAELAARGERAMPPEPGLREMRIAGTFHEEKFRLSATNIRTIYRSAWHREGDVIVYRVTGSGFLHHMVRNLVGTFAQAGVHRISADDVPAILAARSRASAGPTAPASGLFLVDVEY